MSLILFISISMSFREFWLHCVFRLLWPLTALAATTYTTTTEQLSGEQHSLFFFFGRKRCLLAKKSWLIPLDWLVCPIQFLRHFFLWFDTYVRKGLIAQPQPVDLTLFWLWELQARKLGEENCAEVPFDYRPSARHTYVSFLPVEWFIPTLHVHYTISNFLLIFPIWPLIVIPRFIQHRLFLVQKYYRFLSAR